MVKTIVNFLHKIIFYFLKSIVKDYCAKTYINFCKYQDQGKYHTWNEIRIHESIQFSQMSHISR